jgi:hypothetical protein
MRIQHTNHPVLACRHKSVKKIRWKKMRSFCWSGKRLQSSALFRLSPHPIPLIKVRINKMPTSQKRKEMGLVKIPSFINSIWEGFQIWLMD